MQYTKKYYWCARGSTASCLLCFGNISVLIKSSICMCVHVHTVYIVEMDLELWEDWDVGL